jgi:5-(carboxyamino)imidazole ribonucleotide mutase
MTVEPQLAVVAEQSGEQPPLVGIVLGSASDMDAMEPATRELGERGIAHELNVMSAHRQPDEVAAYAKAARGRGLRVLIAGAGL